MSTILIADDEESMVGMLGILFKGEGYEIETASSTDEAVNILESKEVDLVISDMKMPTDGGISILKASLRMDIDRPVVMVTAYASAESAVEAMKLGAYDYITKPFNVDEIRLIVKNGLERRALIRENSSLKDQLRRKEGISEIVGNSEPINGVKDLIIRVADSSSTILITGESGTGKELVARAIHQLSPRKDGNFLSINCGAVPEQLLESELFGYTKGSFTGAVSNKIGLLEAANGGTFFFDEIAEMPVSLQVKLVRALQEREVQRIGGTSPIPLDVRFVAATNRNLEEEVKTGGFREDLYYRLNVIRIKLPSLRERKEDIPALANSFLLKLNVQNKREVKGFMPDVMKLFESYGWRGNVRELENVVERAMVLETSNWITMESLPDSIRNPGQFETALNLPGDGLDLEGKLGQIEKRLIAEALERSKGSKREAAKLLNVNLRSLRYKLSKYDL
ncbi:MAG: sigma-54 dependent transcriptional regulator [Nitrospinota bacterium]|nr:sigma-54 dependent transcriptional regulator [Nitrospinota bacterium]